MGKRRLRRNRSLPPDGAKRPPERAGEAEDGRSSHKDNTGRREDTRLWRDCRRGGSEDTSSGQREKSSEKYKMVCGSGLELPHTGPAAQEAAATRLAGHMAQEIRKPSEENPWLGGASDTWSKESGKFRMRTRELRERSRNASDTSLSSVRVFPKADQWRSTDRRSANVCREQVGWRRDLGRVPMISDS